MVTVDGKSTVSFSVSSPEILGPGSSRTKSDLLSVLNEEELEVPAAPQKKATVLTLLRKIPSYWGIAFAVFAILETLAVVGSVYYVRGVRQQNINTATDIARTSARAFEKALDTQRAPLMTLAEAVTLNPNWPSFNASFRNLTMAIYEHYDYYAIEANPAGVVLAMTVPWVKDTGKELQDLLGYLDFGLDLISKDNRMPYWFPWEADMATIFHNKSVNLVGPWKGPGAIANGAFTLRYSIFLNETTPWELPPSVGITQCPVEICTAPDGSKFWGMVNSIFAWDGIAYGLDAVKSNNLLYTLAPDYRSYQQGLLAHTDPYPAADAACVSIDFYDWLSWTLCVHQSSNNWNPSWYAGLIVGVTLLSLVLSTLVLLVLRSRAEAMIFLEEQKDLNAQLQASTERLEDEKHRLQALMVRQYELIECFGKKPASGKSFTDKISSARRQLADSGTVQMVEDEKIVLHEMLGQGSFGTVYLGEWRGTTVAVKRIVLPAAMSSSDRAEKMAIMEVAISSTMCHPHLVQTYTYSIKPIEDGPTSGGASKSRMGSQVQCDVGPDLSAVIGNSSYSQAPPSDMSMMSKISAYELRLVLEYCDRGSMSSLLEHKGFFDDQGLNLAALLESAADIAKGMLHLHSNNILHTDLKAGNVMLKSNGSESRGVLAKIMDFGLSIALEHTETHVSSMFQGTISHMAPEVLMEGKQSKAADVYAFGITLWELFSSGKPYKGIARAVLGHLVVFENKRPAFPENTPARYKHLAERCWQPNPDARPTFDVILEELRQMREELPGPTRAVQLVAAEEEPQPNGIVEPAKLATAVLAVPVAAKAELPRPSDQEPSEIMADVDATWMASDDVSLSAAQETHV